jgi:Protein of unknown function (DUF3352)
VKRAVVALAFVVAVAAAACGGGTDTAAESAAGDALAYLPKDAGAVVLLSTDFESEQWQRFDREVFQRFGQGSVENLIEEAVESEGDISYDDDVKPLLGNEVVVGTLGEARDLVDVDDGAIVGALEVPDGDQARSALQKGGFQRTGEESGATLYRHGDDAVAAVEGNVVVGATNRETLLRALAIRDGDDGLTEEDLDERLDDLPQDALFRAFGDLESLGGIEELSRFRSVPWVAAVQSFALALSMPADEELHLDAAVFTDPAGLDEEDLPLATGEEAPEIVLREDEISGGNRDQSVTTVFLLRALRAGYPDSRFVRAVAEVESELGIDFEEEILRQFNGPSASYVSSDGSAFAARSEVRDPDALRAVLPRIAPHLPALIEGLQGLQSEGLALLFLFAPDVPLAAPLQGVKVDPPASQDGFYRVSGLTGAGPSELYFNVVDDAFVVASDEQRAREIAEADTASVEGARGAGVARIDLTQLDQSQAPFFLPFSGRELVASLEASVERLRARVRVMLE